MGTQQMNELRADMFRSGTRKLDVSTRATGDFRGRILYYVMPHWPGQAPSSWKRLFYAALAHDTKVVDLYELHSTWGSTENSVHPRGGTYEMVRDSLWEYAQFEDIVQAAHSQASPVADVALLCTYIVMHFLRITHPSLSRGFCLMPPSYLVCCWAVRM